MKNNRFSTDKIKMRPSILKRVFVFLLVSTLVILGCAPSKKAFIDKGQQKMYNERYGEHTRNVMDVYLPAGRTPDTPFVVLIHGGAWVQAGKEYVRDIQDTLLDHGIAVANMNHRYANATDTHYKQMLQDVDHALAYCSEHAEEWGTRDEGFTMVGASSGAHLAMLSSYTTSKSIKAIVDFSGPTYFDDTDLLDYAVEAGLIEMVQMMTGKSYDKEKPLDSAFTDSSPLSHVKDIPVLIIHGTYDEVVPFSQSQILDKKLTSMGFEHKFLKIPNAGHDLDLDDSETKKLVYGAMVDWVLKHGYDK
ncbi:alpha/beta hydrolase [Maribacter sp. PR1]|jgi:acetyl esterase/lipase|uniref:Alpha/beta hydrolase n=1 Tax=Maribacter cobaltidurans TaxID=1178778 RepID=A0ABU7IYY1_9FLAO|nr:MULTISPECIES: alpha/beta hydrolase [Maribacter]MDC6390651.1 alpha/beta hydrolase [Maribacter sp. PR1]MEE1978043.1 alpha/beta hydrolase [Maribacter cobaltidurans]